MKELKSTSQITPIAQRLLDFIKTHAFVICVILFAILAGYILVLTNQLTKANPDQASIDSQLSGVPRPKIDESVVKTIESLEDRNIEIRAIFEEARENPFNE